MSFYSTYDNECMFFVGGNAAKSANPAGSPIAGGCTKTWWDSQSNIDTAAGKQAAMGKLMGSNGEPITQISTTVHTDDTTGYFMRVTDSAGGGFVGVEVGMIAHHPDPAWSMAGNNFYTVKEVDTVNGDWIILDVVVSGPPWDDDGSVITVGGAWDALELLMGSYMEGRYYSQEVLVNKDLAPSVAWGWADWSGYMYNNTWVRLTGFNRVPGDITESEGEYFQTVKSMYEDGVDADCLVKIDMSGLSADFIDLTYSHNIVLRGFYFTTPGAGAGVFKGAIGEGDNIFFEHTAFGLIRRFDLFKVRLLMTDCYLFPVAGFSDVIWHTDATSIITLLNSYVVQNSASQALNTASGSIAIVIGNFLDVEGASHAILSTNSGSHVFSYGNTIKGFASANGSGALRANNSASISSINDILYHKVKAAYAYEVSRYGGSFFSKNACAYSEEGILDEVILLNALESTGDIRKDRIEDLLEVDPLFDANFEPLEEQVRMGGTENISGRPVILGAVNTLDASAAMMAIKARTDIIPSGLDSTLQLLNAILDADTKVVIVEGGWEKHWFKKGTAEILHKKTIHQLDGSVLTSALQTATQLVHKE